MYKEYPTELELMMDKQQSIVDLLIELDKLLKLETVEDTHRYYTSADSEDKIFRMKYAEKIYTARRLLGLSLACEPGALLPCEPVDKFSDLVSKSEECSLKK